jgi:hypothetical protein
MIKTRYGSSEYCINRFENPGLQLSILEQPGSAIALYERL